MSTGAERGQFIVLDGIDGCGKTTQAERLVRALSDERGRDALHLREPGSTAVGERVRALFLDPELTIAPATEALLMSAARRQMLEERVGPALAGGRDVVCERFHPSTFAYQGEAGGLGGESVLELCEGWAGTPAPDLVLLLDVEVEAALARRGAPSDRIEARGTEFQRAVAKGYRRYAQLRPGVVVLDGAADADDVHRNVLQEVRRARA